MPWVQSAGPSSRGQRHLRQRSCAVDDRHGSSRNQATPSPSRASMASMNRGRPCAARRRAPKPGGIGGFAREARQSRGPRPRDSRDSVTRTVAQGWSSLCRPQRVVDHTDAAAFGEDGELCPQFRHRGQAAENQADDCDRRAPFALRRQRLDFRRQQALRPRRRRRAGKEGRRRAAWVASDWGPTGSKMAKVAIS